MPLTLVSPLHILYLRFIRYINRIGLVAAACEDHTAKRCYNHSMKNASMILSHLTSQPQFKYLKRQVCYQKYISLLGKKWQKAIAFVYIKNEILFVAVTHPGFKMELHYNRDLLKSVLTKLASLDKACTMLQAQKVVIFYSKYRSVFKEDRTQETVPYYEELASSDFTIDTQDPELQKSFEKIKETIRCNR